MNFIEIETTTINIDQISTIRKVASKYDPDICMQTEIQMMNGEYFYCDSVYYTKLRDYLKPTKFDKDEKK